MLGKEFLANFEHHTRKMLSSNNISKKIIIENLKKGECPFMYDDFIMHFLYLSNKGKIRKSHSIESNMDETFKSSCEYLKKNKWVIPDMLNIIDGI